MWIHSSIKTVQVVLQGVRTQLQNTEDTDSGADLHVSFTSSGQFVAMFTVGRKAVGDERSVPDCRQTDGWAEVSLTSSATFFKAISIKLCFWTVTTFMS